MGGTKSGGRSDAGANRTTATKLGVGTINEKGKVVGSFFQTAGADKSNKDIDKVLPGSLKIAASILKKPLAKGAKYNRSFFENKVIGNDKKGSKYSSISSADFSKMSAEKKEELYSGFTSDRRLGNADAYGRDVVGGGGNDNFILSTNTEATKQVASSGIVTSAGMVAPTTAEVSQATATDASSSYSSNESLLANNKKGRRSTILQKATGLGDSNLNTTKRTLGA